MLAQRLLGEKAVLEAQGLPRGGGRGGGPCTDVASCSLVETLCERSRSRVRSGRGWGLCLRCRDQAPRSTEKKEGRGKIDGATSQRTAQRGQTLPKRNLRSKDNCASPFCATLAKRARLFCFFYIYICSKSACFGCPGVEQGEGKIMLSAALQIWACSALSSFRGGEALVLQKQAGFAPVPG